MVSDKLYRRMTQETAWETMCRHNGMSPVRISYRRCRGCEGTGKVLNEFRLTTDVPHPTCHGSGTVPYRRTR